ncbi:MAG: hypothetical protein AUK47_14130 [Deltaproteobacteria bacterium CG2_30_63_29]|nr:MAG: hypothetical protein AUK47_14130 [Deltaproteobacteria bacterium CG2_30_63_29]
MKKLRTFVVATTAAASIVVFACVYYFISLGQVDVATDQAQDASSDLADATFACFSQLMNRGATALEIEQCATPRYSPFTVAHFHSDQGLTAGSTPLEDDPLTQSVLATKTRQTARSGHVVRSLYPLLVTESCLKCHSGYSVGEVVGALDIRQDLGPVVDHSHHELLVRLLLLAPLPIVMAILLSLVLSHRIRRSMRLLEENFQSVEPGAAAGLIKVDLGFEEFNGLYDLVVNKLVETTENLRFHLRALERLTTTPRAAESWIDELGHVLQELNTLVPIEVIFTLSEHGSHDHEVIVLWSMEPGVSRREAVEAKIRAALLTTLHGRSGANAHFVHRFFPNGHDTQAMPTESFTLMLASRDAPYVGHILVAGMTIKSIDKDRQEVVHSVLRSMLDLVGSLQAVHDSMKRLEFHATRDTLTNLYNQKLFWMLFEQEIERTSEDGHTGIILLGLDAFKVINDTYGHPFGDRFLKRVAEEIATAIRGEDVLARYGSDIFAICCVGANLEDTFQIAQRVAFALKELEVLADDGSPVRTTSSVGLAVYPNHGSSPRELFSIADDQLVEAKTAGKNRINIPTNEQVQRFTEVAGGIGGLIRRALSNDLIVPYFQPILGLADNRIVAHEVLMRVQLPERLVDAGELIEAAETTRLITKMDLIVLDKALAHAKQSNYPGQLYVNMSPKSLVYPEFLAEVLNLVALHGVAPKQIVFEITEREAVQSIGLLKGFLDGLKAKGFFFAIDDFGVGFSSLQYLRRLPVDILKIDGEFIKEIANNKSSDRAIVLSVTALAKGMGIRTVAEAVEDEVSLQAVKMCGVDYGQGYHIARPGPELRRRL